MEQQLTDDLGRSVRFPYPPQRIVSLCPSQTETLFTLGAGDRVVGRTRWCIHPEGQVASATPVGGTKKVKLDELEALAPDLIIAEKEEQTQAMVEAMAARWPVFVTDVVDMTSALAMIQTLGSLTGQRAEAQALNEAVRAAWAEVPSFSVGWRVAYLIWRKPYMAVGANTYIQSLLARLGLENVFRAHEARYPQTSLAELAELQPAIVMLSSEPYPFGEQHIAEIQAELPSARIGLVDGEMFSWYGSRMRLAADYMHRLTQQAILTG